MPCTSPYSVDEDPCEHTTLGGKGDRGTQLCAPQLLTTSSKTNWAQTLETNHIQSAGSWTSSPVCSKFHIPSWVSGDNSMKEYSQAGTGHSLGTSSIDLGKLFSSNTDRGQAREEPSEVSPPHCLESQEQQPPAPTPPSSHTCLCMSSPRLESSAGPSIGALPTPYSQTSTCLPIFYQTEGGQTHELNVLGHLTIINKKCGV